MARTAACTGVPRCRAFHADKPSPDMPPPDISARPRIYITVSFKPALSLQGADTARAGAPRGELTWHQRDKRFSRLSMKHV